LFDVIKDLTEILWNPFFVFRSNPFVLNFLEFLHGVYQGSTTWITSEMLTLGVYKIIDIKIIGLFLYNDTDWYFKFFNDFF